MQENRKKWKGVKLIFCFFLMAGVCMSLTHGTKNAYAQEEVFRLELAFDTNTGEILRVRALSVGAKRPLRETMVPRARTVVPTASRVESTHLYRLELNKSFIRSHPLVYTWGSPGCIKIQTAAGTERICW